MAIAVKKITYNTVYQIAGKLIATLITLYSLRYLISFLSEGVYARYATATAFLAFFSVLADMGLYMVFMQEIAKPGTYKEKHKILGNIVSLRILSAVILFVMAPIASLLFFQNYSFDTQVLIVLGIFAFIPLAINQLYVALFQKELSTYKVVLSEIVGRTIFLGVLIFTSMLNGSIVHVMGGLVLGNIIHFGITWLLSRKYIRIPLGWDKALIKSILRRAWPLAVAIILNLIYFKIDALMLSKMKGEYAVAVYSIAYKVLEVTIIVPSLILGLILPFLAQYAFRKQKEYKKTFEQTLFAIITLSLPIVLGGIILAQPIIALLSTNKFPEAAPVLQLLMIACGIIFFGNLFNHGIIALGKQKTITWVYGAGAALSIIANLIAIPHYSYIGAAFTTIIIEGLVMILVGIALRKYCAWKWPSMQALKVLLASIAMSLVLWTIRSESLIITIPAGAATYGLILYALRGIPKTFLVSLIPTRKRK